MRVTHGHTHLCAHVRIFEDKDRTNKIKSQILFIFPKSYELREVGSERKGNIFPLPLSTYWFLLVSFGFFFPQTTEDV